MPNGAKLSPSREMEDALMYLPRKGVNDYRKGQTIFDEHQPSKGLHLVVQGRVKVTGNMAKLMALLPLTNAPEYKQLQEQIGAITEY